MKPLLMQHLEAEIQEQAAPGSGSQQPGWRTLTLPFLDRHNDYLQLCVRQTAPQHYEISDDGYLQNTLAEQNRPPHWLDAELRSRGIEMENGAAVLGAAEDQLGMRICTMIEVLLMAQAP